MERSTMNTLHGNNPADLETSKRNISLDAGQAEIGIFETTLNRMLRPNSSVWRANQPSGRIVHMGPDGEWRYEERTRGRLPAFSSETID